MTQPPHIIAHQHCSKHRTEILASQTCGCFYCLAIYSPTDIQDWIDSDQTAICPRCNVDSVIGDAAGFPLTSEFLQQMHQYWFSAAKATS